MKKSTVFAGLLICVAASLEACERVWYLDVVDSTDVAHPVLCLSMKPHCSGGGVDMAILKVDEIEASGRFIRSVWTIQTTSNNPLQFVKFGTVPNGWALVTPAISLESGRYYRIENHVFMCKIAEPHNVCSVLD